MINITFFKHEGELTGFDSSGHAGYADHGQDIVCAGISAILYAVANILDDMGANAYIEEEENRLRVKIVDRSYQDPAIQAVLRVAWMGADGIKQEYGKFLNIKSKEE